MGMIKCPTHGLEFISQCCQHVADACEAGSRVEAHVLLDGWNNPNSLCGACYARALEIVRRASRHDSSTPFDLFLEDDAIVPVCVACLRAWFREILAADLSATISTAREAQRFRCGQIVSARVVAVHPHGVHIEAEGRPGFIQPIEISWTAIGEPPSLVSVGETLEVLIYAITEERFYASVKQARPDENPWKDPARFAAGTVHHGTVTGVVDWGVAVEIAPGVTGMILSERHPGDHGVGDELDVIVVEVDASIQRVELAPR